MSDSHFTPDEEIFKPIPGFPGYDVSNRGRVRSYWRSTGATPGTQGEIPGGRFIATTPQRILKESHDHGGYSQFSIRKDGKRYYFKTHLLVLTVFVGPRPQGMQCCHNDGSRPNNSVKNLRWDTPKNNHRDMRKHGTNPCGERGSLAKLTETQVIKIRKLYVQGTHSYQDIGKMFNVTKGTIAAIIQRRTWTHLP